MSNTAKKKVRKQRVVKNGFIDIDGIDISPGENYSNWINTSKQKLKEREAKLLDIKVKQIELIVNQQLILMKILNVNYDLDQQIIDNTLCHLFGIIDKWEGIKVTRVKRKTLTVFRDYFALAKHWWNQTKNKIFGDVFWVNALKNIHLFIHQQCMIQHQQNQYNHDSKMILMVIIRELFNGFIKYSNTKKQPLVNTGIILYSSEMDKYLNQIDTALTIKQWINEQKLIKKQINKYHCNATIIIERIKLQLSLATSSYISNQSQAQNINIPNLQTTNNTKSAPNFANNKPIKTEPESATSSALSHDIEDAKADEANNNSNNTELLCLAMRLMDYMSNTLNTERVTLPNLNDIHGRHFNHNANNGLQIFQAQTPVQSLQSVPFQNINQLAMHSNSSMNRVNNVHGMTTMNQFTGHHDHNRNGYSSYNGYHGVSFKVIDTRYSPMMSMSTPYANLNSNICLQWALNPYLALNFNGNGGGSQ